MRKPPTIEQAERIQLIVERIVPHITFNNKDEGTTEQFPGWGELEEKREAYGLMKALGIERPQKNCFSCYVTALGKLMQAIGLEPYWHPSKARGERRMAICVKCPAYRKKTISCGRRVTDFFFPKLVKINGVMVKPCGCYLPAKTPLKHAHCPAGKW